MRPPASGESGLPQPRSPDRHVARADARPHEPMRKPGARRFGRSRPWPSFHRGIPGRGQPVRLRAVDARRDAARRRVGTRPAWGARNQRAARTRVARARRTLACRADAGHLRGQSPPHRSSRSSIRRHARGTCPSGGAFRSSIHRRHQAARRRRLLHAAARMDAQSRLGALTAEVGGITKRDGAGPHRQPSVAWIRGRSGAADLIIGGRHLGSAGDPRRG